MVVASEMTIERLRTIALEWHLKNISDARFAIRVYEILREHDESLKVAGLKDKSAQA